MTRVSLFIVGTGQTKKLEARSLSHLSTQIQDITGVTESLLRFESLDGSCRVTESTQHLYFFERKDELRLRMLVDLDGGCGIIRVNDRAVGCCIFGFCFSFNCKHCDCCGMSAMQDIQEAMEKEDQVKENLVDG